MFFKLARKNAHCEDAKRLIDTQREDIKRRMELVEEVNTKLSEAVRKTQEMSVNLTEKVNRELKIARKSLTSISSKLNDGMLMLDYNGHITHMNKSAAKMIGVSEKAVIGKFLYEFVECANPIYDDQGTLVQKPILTHDFFKQLSEKIFMQLTANPTDEKYLICNTALKNEIPFCIETEMDAVLGVKVICAGQPITLRVTLTVLDNDPESIQDVSYIFLFSDHK